MAEKVVVEFLPALEALRPFEGTLNGGYVHDPADPGGETYSGIARKYHPSWAGWQTIDGAKQFSDFPRVLERPALKQTLQLQVRDFYEWEFWAPLQADRLPSQKLANELFEQAVNLGRHKAVWNLQVSLNALNDHGKRWPDIATDGRPGSRTIGAAHAAHWHGMDEVVRKAMNCLQGCQYLQSKNERFIRGWMARVSL